MENTAKNFALQLGSLISLYISIVALIILLSGVITLQYPDVANGYWEQESASSSIRFSIAMLFVFFPTYIALTRMVNTIRRVEQGVYLALTKWLIYLSLLIGGGAILGDLVCHQCVSQRGTDGSLYTQSARISLCDRKCICILRT